MVRAATAAAATGAAPTTGPVTVGWTNRQFYSSVIPWRMALNRTLIQENYVGAHLYTYMRYGTGRTLMRIAASLIAEYYRPYSGKQISQLKYIAYILFDGQWQVWVGFIQLPSCSRSTMLTVRQDWLFMPLFLIMRDTASIHP